jgi:hypothetical protein
MRLHLRFFPLEYAVIELDISDLKFSIVEVVPFDASFLIAKEVIDSFEGCFGVHEVDESHDDQSHGDGDEVEDGEDCVNFGRGEAFGSVHGGVCTEDDDGREDGKHVHQNFDVGPIEQRFEVKLDFLRSDIIYLRADQFFPTIIFDDPNATEILIHAFCSFIRPVQHIFPQFQTFLCNFVLEIHADGEHAGSNEADPSDL